MEMELLETTWKHLIKADQLPPALLTKQMFCKKLEEDNYAAAFSCLANHPCDESHEFSRKSWLNFFRDNSHRLRKETLVRLGLEVENLTARSGSPNLVLENLNSSCKELLRTQIIATDLSQQLEHIKLRQL